MTTVHNSHFDLSLTFPSTWDVTWRGNPASTPEWRSAYQLTDDDLPELNKSKFICTAVLPVAGRPAMSNANIELSVVRKARGQTLRTELRNNLEGSIIIEEGTWISPRSAFWHIDTERPTGRRWRFAVCPMNDEGVWLYGKVSGRNPELFASAVKIFESMTATRH